MSSDSELSRSDLFSVVSKEPLGHEAASEGRLATGLATAVAEAEPGDFTAMRRDELVRALLVIGAAVEAGEGARALTAIAELIGEVTRPRRE